MSQTTTTPNYGLIKPNVNADNDLWGDHWNANADTLDSKIKAIENKAGVTTWNARSGTVSLLQADVTTVLPPSAATPAMDGTASAGTTMTWSKSDHVHPTDTTRYSVTNPSGYVTSAQAATAAPVQSVATRTGAVTLTHNDLTDWAATLAPYAPLASPPLSGSPTAPTVSPSTDSSTKIATTAFVQSALGAVPGGAIVSATPPAANPGALWFDSTGGQTYCRYDDGNTQQWVPVSNITGLANAAQLSDVAPAYNNVGRNLCHNSMMVVAQRGAGPFTATGYMLDRWAQYFVNGSISTSAITASDAIRAGIGDEAVANVLQCNFVGSATAGSTTQIYQPIEGVRRLSGKTAIVSFWAWASVAGMKLGLSLDQGFGTGGSPSAGTATAVQTVTLTISPTRYSLTFSIPSAAGKTLGTSGTDATTLDFFLSNQANAAVGVQTGTIDLWGVQLEIAQPGQTQPTQLEKPDPELQLRQCMRFYQVLSPWGAFYAPGVSTGQGAPIFFPVTMRAAPTVVAVNYTGSSNVSSLGCGAVSPSSAYITGVSTAAGNGYFGGTLTASADL